MGAVKACCLVLETKQLELTVILRALYRYRRIRATETTLKPSLPRIWTDVQFVKMFGLHKYASLKWSRCGACTRAGASLGKLLRLWEEYKAPT